MKQGREIEGKWDEERVARVTKKRPEHCLSYQHTSLRSEFGEQISESAERTENQSAEDTACRRHPTASVSKLCPMFLGSLSWLREELRIFPALPSLSGMCIGKGASESGQKVTCMDVAPATRWTSVDAGTEACEWPGPEGTQLCKQTQHRQNAVLLAQLSSILTQ